MTIYIHNGDAGTKFALTIVDVDGVKIDVSTASDKYLYFQKPDGTKFKVDAVFKTDGKDGIIQYVTSDYEIDQAGIWQVQGFVDVTEGSFFTRITKFEVLPTLYID